MNFEKTKITKKQYFELVKNNVHYNLGTIWSKDLNELDNKLNEVEIKLSDKNTFNNLEFLENNCLKCIGAKKNTVDFLHIQEGKKEYLHENLKGTFYKVVINGILYVYHYYNDSTNTISFKAII